MQKINKKQDYKNQEFKNQDNTHKDYESHEKNLDIPALTENINEIKTMVHTFKEKTMSEVKSAMDQLRVVNSVSQRPHLTKSSVQIAHQNFLHYVRHGMPLEQKGLSEAEGGVLIPHELASFFLEDIKKVSAMRQVAHIVRTQRAQFEAVLVKDRLTAQWGDQPMTPQAVKDMGLEKKIYPIHTLSINLRLPCSLIEDAALDMQRWLTDHMILDMGQKENQAFIWGEGNNQPQGILTVKQTATGERGTLKTTDLVEGDTLVDQLIEMVYGLETPYLNGASWLMSRQTLSKIRRLKNKQGDFLYQTNQLGEQGHTFLGYQIVLCDELNRTDREETLLFGNFSEAYLIIDREDMNLLRDPYSAKPDVDLFIRRRVGGGCKNMRAICAGVFKKEA